MQKESKKVRLCVECNKERKGTHKLCYSCRTRKRREEDPVWDVYYNLRSNAKRRGVKFALSFVWFKEFILGTTYMTTRGTGSEDATLDRIINSKGYVDGNIQVLPKWENSMKGCRDPETHEEGKARWGTPF